MTKGKNEVDWKITENRFVAFLDILGFKDLIMRKSHKEIYELLQSTSKIKEAVQKMPGIPEFTKEHGDVGIHVVNFSDSIVIFSKNDDIFNFKYFLLTTRWIFTSAIRNGIPIKGGFAHGLISLNKTDQIYYGQPLIDAYLMEEEVHYYGVVAHNSIDDYISLIKKDTDLNFIKRILFETKTPLKSGNIIHNNINWFEIIKHDTPEDIRKKIESFRSKTSGSPRKYIDNTLSVFDSIK